jgi:hypothetical protein
MGVKASGGADRLSGFDLRRWHGVAGSRLTSKDGFLCVPLAVQNWSLGGLYRPLGIWHLTLARCAYVASTRCSPSSGCRVSGVCPRASVNRRFAL